MSTIKSSAEDLTLNADGSGNDIIFQSNASNVATLDQAGLLTATTFAGSGASLTALNATNLGSGTVPAARLGNSFVLINSCNPSNASTCTFDSDDITSTYRSYLFVFNGINTVADGAEMRAQVSTDNGSSYVNSGMSRISWYQEDDDASISDGTSDEGGTSIEIAPLGIGNAAGESISGTVWMLGSQDTSSYTHMIIRTSSWGTLFQTTQNVMTAGVPITTVINNIKFYASTGNLADGTITLYGLT